MAAMILLESSSRAMKKKVKKPPLSVRRVELDRYDPDDPFPLIDPSSKSQNIKSKVPVITIRRATYLWSLLLWLLPFVDVDIFNVLPVGILMYSMGLCYIHELFLDMERLSTMAAQQEAWEKQRVKEMFQEQYDRAVFELHVLQGRRNARLVFRQENGVTKLYAID